MKNLMKKGAYSLVVVSSCMLLSACGGGGGSAPVQQELTPASTITGKAAAGAAIIGTVTVKGALNNTNSALIEADGNYTVDVTGLTAPYRLRAEGSVGGRTYKLHSYAVESDVGGNVNITPFTDLIIANTAAQIAEKYFDSITAAELSATELAAQENELQAKLQDVLTAVGLDAGIDLLRASFSTDHSGLDAALDIVRVEFNADTNIATITNLVENTSIQDSVVVTGETDTLVVNDATALTTSATATQQIAAGFDVVQAAFATGLPNPSTIEAYFSADFIDEDKNRSLFLNMITTTPSFIGLSFSDITVSNLDTNTTPNTATVTFSFGTNGVMEVNPVTWFVAKNGEQWEMRGDQRIVETYFGYHCNDYDGTGSWAGACGINTQFWDNDFTNNGTVADAPIASGTVKIIDPADSSVKATIYLGTPAGETAGNVQVYNEANTAYQGDWREFGVGLGKIDPSILVPGYLIEHAVYTADLDITAPSLPVIVGTPVAIYTDKVIFVPEQILTKMPVATDATLTAISNYTIGTNLDLAWTLVAGTRNEEVLVRITDSAGSNVEIWDWNLSRTATSVSYTASELSTSGLLQSDATYSLKVRIYAQDNVTGQSHSRDYDATIPGPAAVTPGPTPEPSPSALICSYSSGWDDTVDGGLGAPINPNSFADFEAVIADCGTAVTFTAAAIAGNTYNENPELTSFNVLTGSETGTQANPGTGLYNDTAGTLIDFQWYVEQSTAGHSYVVIYSDSTIDADLPAGFSLRETSAVTDVAGASFTFKTYSEGSNYGDMDRAVGSDGEIWGATRTQQ